MLTALGATGNKFVNQHKKSIHKEYTNLNYSPVIF